jgi:hypothetical protein
MGRGSDEHVRELIYEALDKAFQAQVEHLFSNWVRDGDFEGQRRAAVGLRRTITAYRAAIEAVETKDLASPAPSS